MLVRPQHAGVIGRPRFQPHVPAVAGDPVSRGCAVAHSQRLQSPIRSGDHVDSAVAAHQDGQVAILWSALARSRKDLFHFPQKGIHEFLIVRGADIVNRRNSFDPLQDPALGVEERVETLVLVDKTVFVIGVEPNELRWIRMLIWLLRHPDPGTPELARQALLYLTDTAVKRVFSPSDDPDQTG